MMLRLEDLRALHRADAVEFFHYDGVGHIVLSSAPQIGGHEAQDRRLFPYLKKESGFPYRLPVRGLGDWSRQRVLTVLDSVRDMAGDGVEHMADTRFEAQAMIVSAQNNQRWYTAVHLATGGGMLSLTWTASDTTDLLRSRGLVRDRLELNVHSASLPNMPVLVLGMCDQVALDDDSRMITAAGRRRHPRGE